jgi:putative CocE/NonD family hydrolase
VTARLFGTSTAACADWVVRLCDVYPDGRSINVVDGIVRAGSSEEEHDVDLWATSIVFRRGHRLRVHVTWSSFPRWSPPTDGADAVERRQVFHDRTRPSHLVIPIIP